MTSPTVECNASQPNHTLLSVDVHTYKFNGYLLVIKEVGSFEYHAERALAYFLPHTIMNTDDIRG